MDQKNKIRIFGTGAELAESACKFIIGAANKAVNTNGQFVVSLSGGHTPEHLYTLLSKVPYRDEMPWNKTFVFWGDERCVPADDKQNNARMAKTLLIDIVGIPPSNIYPIPVTLPPAAAAMAYEKTLIDFFKGEAPRFDLILLGLGENGHTASLFPGTDVISEKEHLVKEVYVAEQKMYRVTMTAPLINQARDIMFLVEGEGKAEILKTVLDGPLMAEKYPAQLINPSDGDLYWFVDGQAAALLSQ